LVEIPNVPVLDTPVPDLVEEVYKVLVVLPLNLPKLDDVFGQTELRPHGRIETKGTPASVVAPVVPVHGGQLEEIPKGNNLHAPKGLVREHSIFPDRPCYHVEGL
jgi:hypothetical protein